MSGRPNPISTSCPAPRPLLALPFLALGLPTAHAAALPGDRPPPARHSILLFDHTTGRFDMRYDVHLGATSGGRLQFSPSAGGGVVVAGPAGAFTLAPINGTALEQMPPGNLPCGAWPVPAASSAPPGGPGPSLPAPPPPQTPAPGGLPLHRASTPQHSAAGAQPHAARAALLGVPDALGTDQSQDRVSRPDPLRPRCEASQARASQSSILMHDHARTLSGLRCACP